LEYELPMALYFLEKDRRGVVQVFMLSPDGSVLKQVTFAEDSIRQFAVSVHGDVLYHNLKKLFYQPVNQRQAEVLAEAPGEWESIDNPHWSPDGRRFVYRQLLTRVREDDERLYTLPELVLYDLTTHETEVLLGDVEGFEDPIVGRISSPETLHYLTFVRWLRDFQVKNWSPDGRYVQIYDGGMSVVYDMETYTARYAEHVSSSAVEMQADGNTVYLGGRVLWPDMTNSRCVVPQGLARGNFERGDIEMLLDCSWEIVEMQLDAAENVLYLLVHQRDDAIALYRYDLDARGLPRLLRTEKVGRSRFYGSAQFSPDGKFITLTDVYEDRYLILPLDANLPMVSMPLKEEADYYMQVVWGPYIE
jgi:hypothetical protein